MLTSLFLPSRRYYASLMLLSAVGQAAVFVDAKMKAHTHLHIYTNTNTNTNTHTHTHTHTDAHTLLAFTSNCLHNPRS